MPIWRCNKPAQRQGLAVALSGVAALLLLAGLYLWMLGGTTPPQPAAIGGPFELTASDGRTVTERSFAGRYLLLYFGYTSCRDVCPITLATVGSALDTLGARAVSIQPLFITVDPARDTPAVLRGYLGGFAPGLLGLTGTPRQLQQVQREYHVVSTAHPNGPGSSQYTVDHTSVLYLIGPDGRFLAPIAADESGADMANDISRHLSSMSKLKRPAAVRSPRPASSTDSSPAPLSRPTRGGDN